MLVPLLIPRSVIPTVCLLVTPAGQICATAPITLTLAVAILSMLSTAILATVTASGNVATT